MACSRAQCAVHLDHIAHIVELAESCCSGSTVVETRSAEVRDDRIGAAWRHDISCCVMGKIVAKRLAVRSVDDFAGSAGAEEAARLYNRVRVEQVLRIADRKTVQRRITRIGGKTPKLVPELPKSRVGTAGGSSVTRCKA